MELRKAKNKNIKHSLKTLNIKNALFVNIFVYFLYKILFPLCYLFHSSKTKVIMIKLQAELNATSLRGIFFSLQLAVKESESIRDTMLSRCQQKYIL